ncbi:tetratricopeptide repeat protein [Kitasatospora sp. NPDC059599]|uniref:tetratricopeptide repeat protein n=1 Tax=Kitasatospora sp. NPDC059599 TaxID=3346880 RepID=UPI0036CB18AB
MAGKGAAVGGFGTREPRDRDEHRPPGSPEPGAIRPGGGAARTDGTVQNKVENSTVVGDVVQAGFIGQLTVVQIQGRGRIAGDADYVPLHEVTEAFAIEHLGVKRSIATANGHARLLPLYIRRRHDEELEHAVQQARTRSVMRVLVADSSCGKTRALHEALRYLRPASRWRLWQPLSSERLLNVIGTSRLEPYTVLWLNESQHYLDGDRGEQVGEELRRLLADAGGPLLVLGTLSKAYHWQLTAHATSPDADHHAQVRELLAGRCISVSGRFSDEELRRAAELSEGDGRLAEALRHSGGRITQYLAAGPLLMERFEHAAPAARAVIEAAMDARRLGHSPGLPLSLVTEAAPDYMTDPEWNQVDENWKEQAIAYVTESLRGADGVLTRIRTRPGEAPHPQPHYRLADYLEQHGRATRNFWCPPASFWAAAIEHCTRPEDLEALAAAARNRLRLRTAAHLYGRLALADPAKAIVETGWMILLSGRLQLADSWFRLAVTLGSTRAMHLVAGHTSDRDEARRLYEQARNAGDKHAWQMLVRWHQDNGERDEARELVQQAADAGDAEALRRLALEAKEAQNWPEAEQYYRRAIIAGDTLAYLSLASLIADGGDSARAEQILQEAAEAGETIALEVLAHKAAEAGDWAHAEQLLRQATAHSARSEDADWLLAQMREGLNDADGALRLYKVLASQDHPEALFELALHHRRRGDLQSAEDFYRKAHAAGITEALTSASLMWVEDASDNPANRARADRLARQAADAGDDTALRRLAVQALTTAQSARARHLITYGLDPDGTLTESW